LDLVLEAQLVTEARYLGINARVFKPPQYLVNGVCLRVVLRELTDLHVGEWDRELGRIWGVDIDWSGVWCCPPLHATDNFLAVIAVVNEGGYHLLVGVVVARNEEGVESE